jgi:hypothetical protein
MAASNPSKGNFGFSGGVMAFSTRRLFVGTADAGCAYIASVWQNNTPGDEAMPVPEGPDSRLAFVLDSDSSETTGDLDDLTVNSGVSPRYMPTGVY